MNERKGLPSASSVHRYAHCPGSYHLERQFGEDEESKDAASGTRIHAVLYGEAVHPPLTDEEEQIVERCRAIEAQLVEQVFGGIHGIGEIREERHWAYDEDLKPQWSGKPDVLFHAGFRGLLIDYKTGRGEVEHAAGNLQLRALAVLAHETYGVADITVAIIQPLVRPEVTTCRYQPSDMPAAVGEIHGIMASVVKENQPRVPSASSCRYCKAKANCPEAQTLVETLPLQVSRDGREMVLSPERIAEFLEKVPAAEAVIEAVRAKARRMLEADPDAIPGWRLKPGSCREVITEPNTVFARFLEAGGTQEHFLPCVTLAKTKLREALRAASGKKGKGLDEAMDTLLAGCTETKPSAPSLERIRTTES
jgi:CRISPR/Cas system-associated exonuclease Cas4 (RecB family)